MIERTFTVDKQYDGTWGCHKIPDDQLNLLPNENDENLSLSESFEKNGYVILHNVLNEQTLELIETQFKIIRDIEFLDRGLDKNSEDSYYGDETMKNSFHWYGAHFSEAKLQMMTEKFSEICQKKLHPCYSYNRIMRKGSFMYVHTDRASCEYSATICIKEDDNVRWPICIENKIGIQKQAYLKAGDMVFYRGCKLHHWRVPFTGTEHIQMMLHYVDSEGEFKDFKYDKREALGMASYWEKLYGK